VHHLQLQETGALSMLKQSCSPLLWFPLRSYSMGNQ
jgi:hypothetical protein